jgi:hypothetical protein
VRDQILSPTLEGVELLPAAALAKVVADSFAKTSEGLRKALSAADGDLAATASKLRCSQRTLFPTPPLALAQSPSGCLGQPRDLSASQSTRGWCEIPRVFEARCHFCPGQGSRHNGPFAPSGRDPASAGRARHVCTGVRGR